jgi:GNAT superfamily N-acetyltransferase
MLTESNPIFAVSGVRETVRYYREVLGFESEWFWFGKGGDAPPDFGGVHWGKVNVMFCLQPELIGKIDGHQHAFHVDDVQALYERHRANGVQIISDIGNKPWGLREYTVCDLNGYHLRFGGPVTYERPATATETLPEHIGIELRKPTLEEYLALAGAVGWNQDRETMQPALEQALFGVVGTDTRDGTCVGMLRVCGDPRQYSIWDVIVLPGHQGQKIGTAMMEAALAELRRRGRPGTIVSLYTGKAQFYTRLGFREGGAMCLHL